MGVNRPLQPRDEGNGLLMLAALVAIALAAATGSAMLRDSLLGIARDADRVGWLTEH